MSTREDLISWLNFHLTRWKVTREDLEDKLDWEEDTISGVSWENFTDEELLRFKHKVEEIVLERHGIRLDPGRIYRIRD